MIPCHQNQFRKTFWCLHHIAGAACAFCLLPASSVCTRCAVVTMQHVMHATEISGSFGIWALNWWHCCAEQPLPLCGLDRHGLESEEEANW